MLIILAEAAMTLGIDEENGPQLLKCDPAGHLFGHKDFYSAIVACLHHAVRLLLPCSAIPACYFFLAPPSPPAAHLSSRGFILVVLESTVAMALIAFTIWRVFFRKMNPTEQRAPREDEEASMEQRTLREDEENRCTYCLENIRSYESLEVLPCGHTLHAACADAWVRPMNTCPVCRCIVDSSGYTS